MTNVNIEKYLIEPVEIRDSDVATNRGAAQGLSTRKVREIYPDAMLLAWYDRHSGESRPRLGCDFGDKPGWIVFAENRGGDLSISVNDGEFIFIYATDPTQSAEAGPQ
jgi:hypothetical protein